MIVNGRSKEVMENGMACTEQVILNEDPEKSVVVKNQNGHIIFVRNKLKELKGLDDVKITSLTIHALPRALESKSWVARIFWLVLFVLGLGFFIKFANVAVRQYWKHDIIQRVTMKSAKKMEFPSVTICNLRSIYAEVDDRHPSTKYKTPRDGLIHYLKHHRAMYKPINFNSFSQGYEKIISQTDSRYCSFGGKHQICNSTMFKTMSLLPKCMTFNPNGNVFQTQSGRMFGLKLLLFLNTSDVGTKKDIHFNSNDQEDIAIMIHKPGTYPDLSYRPIFPETGTHTKVALRRKVSRRLPDPAPSKCVHGRKAFKYRMFPGSYEPSQCKDSCHLYKAYMECGDVPEYYRLLIGPRALPTLNISSIVDQKACLQKHEQDYKVKRYSGECDCPPSCSSVTHETMIISSKWPRKIQEKSVEDYMQKTLGSPTNIINNEALQRDFAFISVFFDDFTESVEEEVKRYSLFSLLSDLGGQAGLYLGASFFSIVELALVLFFYLLGEIKKLIRSNR